MMKIITIMMIIMIYDPKNEELICDNDHDDLNVDRADENHCNANTG